MSPRRRARRPSWARDPAGEKVLAHARAGEGAAWLVGTRSHLAVVPDPDSGEQPQVWPWQQVQSAEWDTESGRLTLREVGEFGRPRREQVYAVEGADRLLRLVRERITASVVLQRHVAVTGTRGFRVIARRDPVGGTLSWMHEYDDGVDPEDPEVARLAEVALAEARAEVGE